VYERNCQRYHDCRSSCIDSFRGTCRTCSLDVAAGAAGDLAGAGIQAAIEEAYPDDVKDIIGKETQEEWNKDIAGTFFIHAGIGAAEGLITGGVGFIVDGVYPAASAELAEIATVGEEGEALELV
jgi:hypothetical protein